jgi:predicted O-methyltransferase YrrM
MNKELTLAIAGELPGQTWYWELAWLYDTCAKSHRHMEIGTYGGRSMFVAAHAMGQGELVTIDARVSERGIPASLIASIAQSAATHCPERVNISMVNSDSIEAAKSVDGNFDSIFIDGDHAYDRVLADIETWLFRLNPGGIICGHDYWPNHWGVMEAVQKVFAGNFAVVPQTRIWFARPVIG